MNLNQVGIWQCSKLMHRFFMDEYYGTAALRCMLGVFKMIIYFCRYVVEMFHATDSLPALSELKSFSACFVICMNCFVYVTILNEKTKQ